MLFVVLTIIVPSIIPGMFWLFLAGWAVYALALVKAWFDMHRYETALIALTAIGYTILSHLWYGLRFIQGLITPKLISRLR